MTPNPFKTLREKLPEKPTQEQMAERTGKTLRTISNWENDNTCPPITDAGELATAYRTTRAVIEQAIVELARRLKKPVAAK